MKTQGGGIRKYSDKEKRTSVHAESWITVWTDLPLMEQKYGMLAYLKSM